MDDPGIERQHGGKGDGVAAYLGAAILGGRFVPGQRLVEGDLTRRLGVGRGLVREALRRLAAEGLIEIVPNRGAQVRRLSRVEALELFEIRTELEAFAARRAAERIGEPGVREAFERATAPIRAEGPRHGGGDYIMENRAFHGALVKAAGNCALVAVHEKLQLSLILAQIRFALGSDLIAASLAEHRAIAEAVHRGDSAEAEATVRAHLGRATEIVRGMPADAFRGEEKPDRRG